MASTKKKARNWILIFPWMYQPCITLRTAQRFCPERQADKLLRASSSQAPKADKQQASSDERQACKLQAASCKLPNNFSLIKFPVSSSERLYQDKCVLWMLSHETQFDVVRSVFYYLLVTFNSTVKKCWCLLYPSTVRKRLELPNFLIRCPTLLSGVFFFNF